MADQSLVILTVNPQYIMFYIYSHACGKEQQNYESLRSLIPNRIYMF